MLEVEGICKYDNGRLRATAESAQETDHTITFSQGAIDSKQPTFPLQRHSLLDKSEMYSPPRRFRGDGNHVHSDSEEDFWQSCLQFFGQDRTGRTMGGWCKVVVVSMVYSRLNRNSF